MFTAPITTIVHTDYFFKVKLEIAWRRNISSIMWGFCGGVYVRYAHFPGQFNSAVQIVVIQMATL